ncbi:MAG: TIM-barrel domain-containing protein [Mangrovibacterium sp.]
MQKRNNINCQFLCFLLFMVLTFTSHAQEFGQISYLLNEPVDISHDFKNFKNTYFVADSLALFDPVSGEGLIKWQRMVYKTRQAFDNMLAFLRPSDGNEFPANEYEDDPHLPFSVSFVSGRTIRIRMNTGFSARPEFKSLMLINGTAPSAKPGTWKYSKTDEGYRYTSAFGSVVIQEKPWHIKIYDASGKLLTQTDSPSDNEGTYTPIVPFSFVRRSSDYSRSMAASFTLSPGEKIFGCGESFKNFNKRGQRVVLYADDANGTQNEAMYKPVPFFMSSRGYGMFIHTSAPVTCDFGASFGGVSTLMTGDDQLDLFIFLGEPKAILDEYTDLTGKASMPPLWSFGLWMSRITYNSEKQGYEVAAHLRKDKIPADVIHFDTGWFETDWRCDYQFSTSRFEHPEKMIEDLGDDGFHICLWQLPYFVPKNKLFPEIVQEGLYIKDAKGNLTAEDAMLDFTNPDAVKWYQEKLADLLKMGVGAIKVDFGEAVPLNGIYANGRTGFYEHNLYPLRYNKAAHDGIHQVTGEHIIWARSAWAGSQRYPLHWGGDAANSNTAMAATLRGGLSLGLSGFAFWSHDIGGFVQKTPEDLYRRWLPFGLLSSHSRCHGEPPKEPWAYGKDFENAFRRADNLRYRLMPYIYAQAKVCTEKGLPMVRALFVEFPHDAGSWMIDDEYLLGSDMLVAPLFENVPARDVYLPGGKWIDYQTGKVYDKGWNSIRAGNIPVVLLVRDGTVIPHIELAQCTREMDWSKLDLVVFSTDKSKVHGLVCLPSDNKLNALDLYFHRKSYLLDHNPLEGKTIFTIEPCNPFMKKKQ